MAFFCFCCSFCCWSHPVIRFVLRFASRHQSRCARQSSKYITYTSKRYRLCLVSGKRALPDVCLLPYGRRLNTISVIVLRSNRFQFECWMRLFVNAYFCALQSRGTSDSRCSSWVTRRGLTVQHCVLSSALKFSQCSAVVVHLGTLSNATIRHPIRNPTVISCDRERGGLRSGKEG